MKKFTEISNFSEESLSKSDILLDMNQPPMLKKQC